MYFALLPSPYPRTNFYKVFGLERETRVLHQLWKSPCIVHSKGMFCPPKKSLCHFTCTEWNLLIFLQTSNQTWRHVILMHNSLGHMKDFRCIWAQNRMNGMPIKIASQKAHCNECFGYKSWKKCDPVNHTHTLCDVYNHIYIKFIVFNLCHTFCYVKAHGIACSKYIKTFCDCLISFNKVWK